MTLLTTLYLSRLLGCDIYDRRENIIGKILNVYMLLSENNSSDKRPVVSGFKIKRNGQKEDVKLDDLTITKFKSKYKVQCDQLVPLDEETIQKSILLKDAVLDKQIVDISGHKLVRVNDIRMVYMHETIQIMAVDVGTEGLLRRLGLNKFVSRLLKVFGLSVPSRFILWDDVESIDPVTMSIHLSTTREKLNRLHPSDLADIIEDLGKDSKTKVFAALDEEKAADVLEEMEDKDQVHIIESLPLEKAADVLEKMPADEAAYIMDNLEDSKAAQLLLEMEQSASDEVRELLEYPDNTIGSLMNSNVLTFSGDETVKDILNYIKTNKPDMETLYGIFIVDKDNIFSGTITLRDLLVSDENTPLREIMNKTTIAVNDYDDLDSLSEIVSKYNLLAIPVINDQKQLEGMVVIDDIIDDLLDKRRTT